VSFRLFSFGKPINKLIHASFHSLAVICFSLGLAAVVVGNNQTNKNTSPSGYYANIFSLHSCIGFTALFIYSQNYVLGLTMFLYPRAKDVMRAAYVQYHIPLGYLFLVTATAAICCGVMELNTENGCQPIANSRDIDTTANYMDLPLGCKIGNGIGIFALLGCLCTLFTIIDLRHDQRLESVVDPSSLLM
jgi:uncharacterized membrane protein (UPF0182 family)